MKFPSSILIYHRFCKYIFCLALLVGRCVCYNIEVKKFGLSRGPSGSQFGYTVAIVRKPGWTSTTNEFYAKELLVGAPNFTYNNIVGHGQISGCTDPTAESIDCDWLNVTDISKMCDNLSRQTDTDCAMEGRLGATMEVNRRYPDVRADQTLPMITVCAPGWKNVYPEIDPTRFQNYMIGMCLKLRDDLNTLPCYRRKKESCWPFWPEQDTTSLNGRPVFTYAQAGLAATFTQDGRSEVIAAPGADDWRGAFRAVQKGWLEQVSYSQAKTIYFGYAITTGQFERDSEKIVSGSPNWNSSPNYGHYGKVQLFNGDVKIASIEYGISQRCTGQPLLNLKDIMDVDQMGSKFGATLEAVDITGDGLDELLVAAPLYTGARPEEGRVFVYTTANEEKLDFFTMCGPIGILSGGANVASLKEKTSFARFGTAIASTGDLDRDGYNDIAIGAPYEDEGAGAVYIYQGIGECGCEMEDRFTQRITGDHSEPEIRVFYNKTQLSGALPPGVSESKAGSGGKDFDAGIRSFGWSLYGNDDIDDNSFPDLAVGAYESDSAIMLRTRPIVDIAVDIDMSPNPIPLNGSLISCSLDKVSLCFEATVTITYFAIGTRQGDVDEITLAWTLDSDTVHKNKEGWSRVEFRGTNGQGTWTENITLSSTRNRMFTTNYIIDVKGYRGKPEPKDAWTKVRMEGSFELVPTSENNFAVLDPIIHKDAKREIVEYIEFDKKCDSIATCTSNLRLFVEMFMIKDGVTPTEVEEDTVIYIDAANILEVTADVTNLLNSSYRANLTGEVTALMKRDASANNGLVGASCMQESPHQTSTSLSCTADSKLDRNENMKIKMYFDISRQRLIPGMNMDRMKEFVHFYFKADQANLDVNGDNNMFEKKIGVKLKYALRIEEDKGKSDQVRYKADASSTRVITLTHRYYIINDGPSFLPKTYVNITVPLSHGGIDFAVIKNIPERCQVRGDSSLTQTTTPVVPTTQRTTRHSSQPETEVERKRRETLQNPKTAKSTGEKSDETLKGKNITCIEYTCAIIECEIVNLEKTKDEKQEYIDITIDVYEKELAKEKDQREVRYATNATVTDPVVWFGGKVVPWDKTVYAEKWTTFVVEPTSVVSEVNIWIIIGSVLGALALLVIVIVILWRCGFFARKKHSQVQQWKRASLYNRKSVRMSTGDKQPYNAMEDKEN